MSKKIITFYLSIFILFFIVVYSVSFFYKNYIFNLKIENIYHVTSFQVGQLKEKSLNRLLDDLFSNNISQNNSNDNNYIITRIETSNKNNFYTLESPTNFLFFEIKTKKYIEPEILEKKLNDLYFESFDTIIDLFKNYEVFSKNKNELINSKIFKVDKVFQSLYFSSICIENTISCNQTLSSYARKSLYQLLEEKNHFFKVKLFEGKERHKFNPINELVINLGITLLFGYFFFNFTIKFFRKKLK